MGQQNFVSNSVVSLEALLIHYLGTKTMMVMFPTLSIQYKLGDVLRTMFGVSVVEDVMAAELEEVVIKEEISVSHVEQDNP